MFLGHDESDAVYKYIRLKRPKLRNMCPKKILFSEESAEYIFLLRAHISHCCPNQLYTVVLLCHQQN